MKSSIVKCASWMVLGAVTWIVGSMAFGAAAAKGHHGHAAAPGSTVIKTMSTDLPKVQRVSTDTVLVPDELAQKIGLRTTSASAANRPVKLPSFHGVLALDTDCLSNVHTRFGGEVVELGYTRSDSGPSRPLRVGDHVQQGDLLAVVWSTDLGSKKSELVDALAKLHAEEDLRDKLKKLASEGASPARNYRDAEKAVQSRIVEVANAERMLRTWRTTDADIAVIRQEAERLTSSQPLPADLKDWARVEVRAPITGVILEKNIAVGGLVDTATELYKIGDTSHLMVWAHVFEEDLPLLESLPQPFPWTVSVPSRTGMNFSGSLDRIGAVIDQTQHTALISGRVANPKGDLKAGQFVTVAIELPPSQDEIELPVTAVVEDGRSSVAFIENEANHCSFCRRPVMVVRRSRDSIYVKSDVNGVRPGARVMTAGALMVNNAMDQQAVPMAQASSSAEVSTKTLAAALPY